MARFVGYLNRRPYLWFVDVENRAVEPAAELRDIPQGIDEVVPVGTAVAVRCGRTWFALEPDLSGRGRTLTETEGALAEQRSARVRFPELPSVLDRELVLPSSNGDLHISHPAIAYWRFAATRSPDGRKFAIGGSTTPFVRPTRPIMEEPYRPDPSVLALIDTATGAVRVCEGTFDNFCYPPAWSATGDLVAFGAPFEPKRLYTVRLGHEVLEAVPFKRNAPMPLLDSTLLPSSV